MKAYLCLCNICGSFFMLYAEFLSAGGTITIDGRNYPILPGACPAGHSAEQVREQWEKTLKGS